jgi:hypothetical protein
VLCVVVAVMLVLVLACEWVCRWLFGIGGRRNGSL